MICPKCKFLFTSTLRSNPQNKYYFGVVLDIISQELGYDVEEAHDILKLKFLKHTGKTSTTGLTTLEFKNYLERIQRWAAQELGCSIPDPNEKDYKEVVKDQA